MVMTWMIAGIMLLNGCREEARLEETGPPQITTETILTGYDIIWGMDFLPNGDLIFGEKRGKLYQYNSTGVTEITGVPPVHAAGQGGLMDIRVHPEYAKNGWIYASYAERPAGSGARLKLIRFKITGNQVSGVETLLTTDATNTWYGHYGSRILFGKDGYLYLSVGEGGTGSYGGPAAQNNHAQDPQSAWGKIHRLNDDGSIPADNPVIPGNTVPSSIFSTGHRNPQGLALHPETGRIWSSEHGPRGGDEINIIGKGKNYGWPDFSVGVNYDGTPISGGQHGEGITSPLYTWTPSIGICGIAFITSETFKSWKGNLLVSGLASQKLYRCVTEGEKITGEHVLLSNSGRIRNVVQGPDGSVYVSAENPGRIIRITPEQI